MPLTTTQGATGDRNINGVLSGYKWGITTLAYAFPTLASQYGPNYGDETLPGNWVGPISNAAQQSVLKAFAAISSFTNLNFTLTSDPGTAQLRFAESKPAYPTAYAYYPNGQPQSGDAWFSTNYAEYRSPKLGDYGQLTIWHELGHALGLKHGHETGGPANVALTTDRDSMEFSVMTYKSYVGADSTAGYQNEQFGYAQSYMMYDIAALQEMYGADYTSNAGNTTYTFSATTGEMFINGVGQGRPGNGNGGSSNRVFRTIWDGGGVDTYDFSNYANAQTIDLRAGNWSKFSNLQIANLGDGHYARANVFNALMFHGDKASLIENAIGGSGSDQIKGNQVANVLTGNAGNDKLYGFEGNDTLNGGAGNDYLSGGIGTDTATYATATAAVKVSLAITAAQNTLGAGTDTLVSIENLIGSKFNDTLTGNSAANTLTGGAGNDRLDGGAGIDTASYATATAAVKVSLAITAAQNTLGAGTDTLVSIENLLGSKYNDTLTGDAGNNLINGSLGNDTLNGGGGHDRLVGGAGVDTLTGGTGNDTFIFARASESTPTQRDTITDFVHGTDKIDLTGLYAGTLHVISGDFTHAAGQVHVVASGADRVVEADLDGNGTADFAVLIKGAVTLTASDFLL